MAGNQSLTKTATALLSRFFVAAPRRQAEETLVEKSATGTIDITQSASDAENAMYENYSPSPDGHIPGAFPQSVDDPLERLYIEYLQKQKEIDDDLRLARQTSKEMQEKLHRLREAALETKCREAQKIERLDEHLRKLAQADTSKHAISYNPNGMVGPAPTTLAFGASITFVKAGPGIDLAPGSRWPGGLSAQRNCGFGGGGKSGLRRDAVNAEEELAIEKVAQAKPSKKSRISVPTGLQEAMKKGQVISISAKKESNVVQDGRFEDVDFDEEWLTEEDDEDVSCGKTEGISNIKIKRRVAEKVDDVIVRQVGVKRWSLEEHMRKKQKRRQ